METDSPTPPPDSSASASASSISSAFASAASAFIPVTPKTNTVHTSVVPEAPVKAYIPWSKKPFVPRMMPLVETKPVLSLAVRNRESHYLKQLITDDEPVIVYFKLFDASIKFKIHTIPSVLTKSGCFGYMTKKHQYVDGLHSFELMWYIRSEYDLSGTIDYDELIKLDQTHYCLKHAYLETDNEDNMSIHIKDLIRKEREELEQQDVRMKLREKLLSQPNPSYKSKPISSNLSTPVSTPKVYNPFAVPPPLPHRGRARAKAVAEAMEETTSMNSSSSSSSSSYEIILAEPGRIQRYSYNELEDPEIEILPATGWTANQILFGSSAVTSTITPATVAAASIKPN